MPAWSAENELKLATAIIALHQVKVNKEDCDRLAAIIGDGCTAKAITHRVQKFRDAASKLGLQNGAAPFTTPASGKKRARKTKTDDDQDGGDADDTPTKKPRTPKVKNSAVIKDDTVDVEQMVKKELSDEDDIEVAA